MLLEIVSPEASLFKECFNICTSVDGSFQILNNHAPIVSLLQKERLFTISLEFSKEGLLCLQ
jgi:F-type H+-transporting ATPase subunit epsilon